MNSEQGQINTMVINNIDTLEPIDTQTIDFTRFEGTKVPIEKTGIIEVNSYYDENGNKISTPIKVKTLKVESTVVTTLTTSEGNSIEIRASELFNLAVNSKSNRLGWSKAKNGKLNQFLNKLNVDHPKFLIGKTATIRIRKKKNQDGSESEFLGFII